MLTRIVQLSVKENSCEQFESFFRNNHPIISSFPGCSTVRLQKDMDNKNTYFTISEWNSDQDLEDYRNSDFFKRIWPLAKEFFSSPALAWSTIEITP